LPEKTVAFASGFKFHSFWFALIRVESAFCASHIQLGPWLSAQTGRVKVERGGPEKDNMHPKENGESVENGTFHSR
jgi:hypothetical protein